MAGDGRQEFSETQKMVIIFSLPRFLSQNLPVQCFHIVKQVQPFGVQFMKNIKLAIFTVILLSFVLCVPPPQSAQTVLTGTWKANDNNWNWNRKNKDKDDDQDKDDVDKVHLTFHRENQNGNWTNGSSFDYSDLQGLTKEEVNGSNVSVKFRLVREAGTIECDGKFDHTKGSGNWRFTSNRSFSDR